MRDPRRVHFSSLCSRRPFWLILVVLLLGACDRLPLAGPAPSSPEAVVDRTLAAVQRPGKVFHARLQIETPEEAGIYTAEVWFDGERQAARREERRNDELTGVTVWEGWTSAHYAPQTNQVYTSTTPIDYRAEGANPALEAFAPGLLSLPLQPQWEITGGAVPPAGPGERDGDAPWRIEVAIPIREGEWGVKDHRLLLTTEVNGHTFLPIREEVGLANRAGSILFSGTITYLETGFLDRERLPPDFLTLAAVQAMYETLEERLAQARTLDTVWWLGWEYAHPFEDADGQRRSGLTLRDLHFEEREGQVVAVALEYGLPEAYPTYVTVWQYPAAEWTRRRAEHRPWWQTDEAEAETVLVHGVKATLYTRAGMVPPGPELVPTPTVPPEIATAVAEKSRQRVELTSTPTPAPLQPPPMATPKLAATPQVVTIEGVPPSYTLILPLEGTVIRIETLPMVSGRRQVNPFHDREAIVELAQALTPLR